MTEFTFSPRPVVASEQIQVVGSQELIESALCLRRCSLENAMKFGGKIVRQLLETAPIEGQHSNVYVETVANHLFVGHIPTQPGWHLDDIPKVRPIDPIQVPGTYAPDSMDYPSLSEMKKQTDEGRTVRHHTIIVGNPCPTAFVKNPLTLDIEHADNWNLIQDIHMKTRAKAQEEGFEVVAHPNGVWTTWDWWNLHCPVQAHQSGWRLLLRIVEGGEAPLLNDFVISHKYVFVPSVQCL